MIANERENMKKVPKKESKNGSIKSMKIVISTEEKRIQYKENWKQEVFECDKEKKSQEKTQRKGKPWNRIQIRTNIKEQRNRQ